MMIRSATKSLCPHASIIVRHQHANNARVIDVKIVKGQGARVWDKNGKEYLDFIGGQGSLNLGHCHPRVLCAVQDQISQLHQTTRCLNNLILPEFCETICQMFNYDQVVALNTSNEACELAMKLCRLWGYKIKKICPKDAIFVCCTGGHWGCSIAAISSSIEPLLFNGYQPLLPGIKLIPYNDVCSLEEAIRPHNVCGFMIDPIQSENAGVTPSEGYLAEVRRLCTQNKVLWVADETTTGLGRTGAMLAVDHECVKPDILCLGKSLGGGYYPMSAVLSSCEVMELLKPGSHTTTFGGNVLGSRLASTTLKLIKEECIAENASAMGALLRDGLLCSINKDDMPVLRGKGLLYGLKIDPRIGMPCDICAYLRDCGLLVWPCKDEFIRLTPPLIVSEEEVSQAVSIIKKVVDHMKGTFKNCPQK